MNDPRPTTISARPLESRSTGELLKQADGIDRAEHGDGTHQAVRRPSRSARITAGAESRYSLR
jgi:hypothetical protein